VEVFHNGELMEDWYKLMDVAYMFDWDRVSVLSWLYVYLSAFCVSLCLTSLVDAAACCLD